MTESYPFEEEGLRKLLQLLPHRTPRAVNIACSAMVDKMFSTSAVGKHAVLPITASFIEKNIGPVLELLRK
jgi:hypothetical protein